MVMMNSRSTMVNIRKRKAAPMYNSHFAQSGVVCGGGIESGGGSAGEAGCGAAEVLV